MSKPFDLDAVVAERDPQEPFAFTFGGEQYTLPGPEDVDLVVMDHLANGEAAKGLRLMLGDEQWGRIEASPARLTGDVFRALSDAWASHYRGELGES